MTATNNSLEIGSPQQNIHKIPQSTKTTKKTVPPTRVSVVATPVLRDEKLNGGNSDDETSDGPHALGVVIELIGTIVVHTTIVGANEDSTNIDKSLRD